MSGLVSNLPAQQLVTGLREAERLANEIKSRQRISSIGGQLSYLIQNAATWDVNETFTTTPPFTYQQKTLQLTYTADGSQSFPVALPYLDLRINGTADANRVDYLFGGGFAGDLGYHSGSDILLVGGIKVALSYLADEQIQRWTILLTYQGSITIRAKAQVVASSGGSVELVRL
ncbi:hypothetical protein ACWFRF_15425 [Nocardia sp. NPDC055165]